MRKRVGEYHVLSYLPRVSSITGHKESRVGVVAHRPKRT